jgi:hypothetical protein
VRLRLQRAAAAVLLLLLRLGSFRVGGGVLVPFFHLSIFFSLFLTPAPNGL